MVVKLCLRGPKKDPEQNEQSEFNDSTSVLSTNYSSQSECVFNYRIPEAGSDDDKSSDVHFPDVYEAEDEDECWQELAGIREDDKDDNDKTNINEILTKLSKCSNAEILKVALTAVYWSRSLDKERWDMTTLHQQNSQDSGNDVDMTVMVPNMIEDYFNISKNVEAGLLAIMESQRLDGGRREKEIPWKWKAPESVRQGL